MSDPHLPFVAPTRDERRLDALGKLIDIREAELGRNLTRGETLQMHAALGFHDALERILESDTRPAVAVEKAKTTFVKPLAQTETPGTGCPPAVREQIRSVLEGGGDE